MAVLEGFEKADATFEDRHAFLSKVLTPGEHLEVCRLAAEQAMGLNDLGDAGAIAVARPKTGAESSPWSSALPRLHRVSAILRLPSLPEMREMRETDALLIEGVWNGTTPDAC